MKEYVPTIGLEIHVQLKTRSKMFCRCDNNAEGKEPNTVVCPLCMGFPGTLPVANEAAIEWGAKTALALNCSVNKFQRFDRKNYFYPDLPKGYQISQFFFPVGEHGQVSVDYLAGDRKTKKELTVGITRLHLEEDAGKLVHRGPSAGSGRLATLVDFNRCGTPLMEIVTEPDIGSPEEARAFMQELQRIVRALGVSYADMEKGHLRVDANVSVRPKGTEGLGTKIEVKNMNSFKFMEQALRYEIERQIKVLEEGGALEQETRGWDEKTGTTLLQRGKEGSIDYRYFPEPDLPPIELTEAQIKKWGEALVALPSELRAEAEKLGLSYNRVAELQDKGKLSFFVVVMGQAKNVDPILAANFIDRFDDESSFISFIEVVSREHLSASAAQKYLATGQIGKAIDEAQAEKIAREVLDANPDVVRRYQAGETKLLGWLTGQVMAKAKGGADPALVQQILRKLLTK